MVAVFWNAEFTSWNVTVEYYANLVNKFRERIKEKRRRKLLVVVKFFFN